MRNYGNNTSSWSRTAIGSNLRVGRVILNTQTPINLQTQSREKRRMTHTETRRNVDTHVLDKQRARERGSTEQSGMMQSNTAGTISGTEQNSTRTQKQQVLFTPRPDVYGLLVSLKRERSRNRERKGLRVLRGLLVLFLLLVRFVVIVESPNCLLFSFLKIPFLLDRDELVA